MLVFKIWIFFFVKVVILFIFSNVKNVKVNDDWNNIDLYVERVKCGIVLINLCNNGNEIGFCIL